MEVRPNTIIWTVAEYCAAFERKEILVDRKYQRNASVWPVRAQSYLIETILKGFPIPKLALHQTTDLTSKKTIKYIIDGQQRTNAIVDFFNDELRLSRSIEIFEARGKTFDGLDSELKHAFLAYPLQLDMFEATGEEAVREYFRRINSFTAPLNAEERRNAEFQGNMKWFMLHLAEKYSDSMVAFGTLKEKQVVRIPDQKILGEVVHDLLEGVKTTNARMLNGMYRKYEKEAIPMQEEIEEAISRAFDRIFGWKYVRETDIITKGYNLYSLILAIITVEKQWGSMQYVLGQEGPKAVSATVEESLLEMADALMEEEEEGSGPPHLSEFVRAARAKTNTREQRETRIRLLAAALGR